MPDQGRNIPTPEHLEAGGDCYQLAADWVINQSLFTDSREWVLVHGRPLLQRAPFCEYGHAWAERGYEVYDPQAGYRGAKQIYYAIGKIDPDHCIVYSFKELQTMLTTYQHYGPWEGPDALEIA
tara:strand:+ start:264 stop:635 length:372 start_codon:yes stop_codon:yes gene_type:complete